jgi:hypothetical protein
VRRLREPFPAGNETLRRFAGAFPRPSSAFPAFDAAAKALHEAKRLENAAFPTGNDATGTEVAAFPILLATLWRCFASFPRGNGWRKARREA